MKLKSFFLLLLSLYIVNCTLSIDAQATIRYVSKTGTSTPPYTSWDTAADSIQKCINICSFGDTIYVANGIYKENLVINTAISLIGSSMDSTVIDGTGLNDMTVTFNVSGLIDNFNILGKGEEFLTSRVVRSTNQTSLLFISNCRLSQSGVGVSMVGGDVIAEKIYMTNLGRGFNLFGVNVNRINNCIIILSYENANGINIGFSPNILNYLTNNIILSFAVNHGSDEGIYCGLPKKVYISNNLISGFGVNIFVNGVEDTAFIRNNILTNAGVGITADINSKVNNVVFSKNNIGIDNYSTSNKFDYNIYWKNNHNFRTINAQGDSDIIADPMFVKDTIANAQFDFDYHLQAFSPGIDKGDPNILDLDGTRSDIGMYGGPFGETYTYQDLAPLAPRNLSGVVDTNRILVKWNRNTEADTAYYKVYRDTVSGFAIDSTKLVSASADTLFIHPNLHNVTKYVYKITCVDKQGNESKPSVELVVNITSVSTNDYPMTISDYVLYQNYPNPFNPSTKIGYQIKERAYVKLMVYDIKGELISILVNKEQNAGYYEVDFSSSSIKNQESSIKNIASGIYLYRIEVIGEGNIPVFTDMKKMMLVK
jgi:hypothetical protein